MNRSTWASRSAASPRPPMSPARSAAAEPPFFHYKLLKEALAHYHKLALQAPLPALPPIKATRQAR